jgi:hypothetical protein
VKEGLSAIFTVKISVYSLPFVIEIQVFSDHQQFLSTQNTTLQPLHVQIYSIPLHVSVNHFDLHQAEKEYKYKRKNAIDASFLKPSIKMH